LHGANGAGRAETQKESCPMLALLVIGIFLAAIIALNIYEFGRPD
jgi:hypothetical protein